MGNEPTVIVEQKPTVDPVTERLVKLEGRVDDVRRDLSDEISRVSSSVKDELVKHREEIDKSIGDRLGSIDKKLEELKPKQEQKELEQTGTNVEDVMLREEMTKITNEPTEIHPPTVPKGRRGRRRARKNAGRNE